MQPRDNETTADDYSAILDAVMETSRGRWFLDEYARRNRSSDTVAVLDAVGRLERTLAGAGTDNSERFRLDLMDMAGAIARTKAEIAAIKPESGDGGRIVDATGELDAIVKATETATGEILAAAEHLQEVAWTLRESGVEGAACDIIDQRATDIYMACSFQDITGQRTNKVIQVLRYLEHRIDTMMMIWSDGRGNVGPAEAPPPMFRRDDLLNGPALPGHGLDQSDVDMMMGGVQAAAAFIADPLPLPAALAEPLPLPDLEPLPIAIEPIQAVEPPVFQTAVEPAPSPFSPVARPKAKAKSAEPKPVESKAADVKPAEPLPPEPANSGDAVSDKPVQPVKPAKVAGMTRTVPAKAAAPVEVSLADIEALPFEERAALFS